MHFTPTFLLLVSLIGAAQAVVDRTNHEVSFIQHRRHHAKAAAARAAQPQRRSRRSCKLNSSSILAIATATGSVDTSPASATQTASSTDIATSTADSSSEALSSLSSVISSATSQVTSGITSQDVSSTMVSASSSAATTFSTASTTSSNGTSTQTASDPTGTVSLKEMLLPVKPISYWTTAEDLPNALPLNDETLTPTHDIKALKHEYLKQAGKSAMSAFYPKGSWNLSNQPRGGFSFYATGPTTGGIDLTKAKEVTFSYSVFFPEGFEFVKGGKLPGLWGGDDFEGSISCSGGSRNDKCFSSRVMWRTDGAGELYTYLPPSFEANNRVCDIPPYSECNPTYGASIARGSFTFATGDWTAVAMRVKLNDVGKENGELELWANGKSMFIVDGLVIRDSEDGLVWGDQMQTFFGGSTQDWSTPKDQNTYFADFTMAVTETF